MSQLHYRTAGESHGPALISLVEGLPSGVEIDVRLINAELARRQGGYGRGGRQKIETDRVEFLTGVRNDRTIGSPITIMIVNKDNRLNDPDKTPPLTRPRPGHADLAGSIKWLTVDCRETLERASARETAARVAAGALSRSLLNIFGIRVFGFVRQVGEVSARVPALDTPSPTEARPDGPDTSLSETGGGLSRSTESNKLDELIRRRDASDLYCPDEQSSARMRDFITDAKMAKDTAGGIVECQVFGCPIGLGSSMTIDGRLDGRIMGAVGAIQAFKGVEIGMGFGVASRFGSQVHDEIIFDPSRRHEPGLGFTRTTNNAGGLEGGMTNGMPLIVRAAMKPISTLGRPLKSVDLSTMKPSEAGWERSDISAISAASVIVENVVAFEIARALLEKFGGDSIGETRRNYDTFLTAARALHIGEKAE